MVDKLAQYSNGIVQSPAKLVNVKNAPISWLINREILAMEETTDVTPDTPPARKR